MSSSMFALHKELMAPTSIDNCIEARFTAADVVNLIVTRANVLQIYIVSEEDAPESYTIDAEADAEADLEDFDVDQEMAFPKLITENEFTNRNRPKKIARLELLREFKLHGLITSVAAVRTSTLVGLEGMDSLLLSFRDAKMSLIEYCRATSNIVTVSIHYYEREEFKKESLTDKWVPEIRVDPEHRCAVLNFYNDRLAILPLRNDGANTDDLDPTSKRLPYQSSFVISLSAIDTKIRNVVDIVFLHGFLEPTLAILYETTQTWTGRLANRRDTKSLSVVSLDIVQKSYPILYTVQNLPYNCFKLMGAPSPVGGIMIFSPNSVLHVDQTSVPGVAVAVNPYYGIESAFSSGPQGELGEQGSRGNPLYTPALCTDYKHLGAALDGCSPFFLNPDTLLLVLRSGEMLIIHLEGQEDAGRGWKRKRSGVKRFRIERVGLRSTMPVCGIRIGGIESRPTFVSSVTGGGFQISGREFGYIFIASRVTDAMLIQYWESSMLTDNPDSLAASGSAATLNGDREDIDDLEMELYGETYKADAKAKSEDAAFGTEASSNETNVKYSFRVCDSLVCGGPIRSMAVGAPVGSSIPEYSPDPSKSNMEIVACVGEVATGSLAVLQRNLRPQVLGSFEIPGVIDMWTIKLSHKLRAARNEFRFDGGQAGLPGLEHEGYHRYLVLSRAHSTTILETGDEIQEVDSGAFYRSGATVVAGSVLEETLIVQVYPGGILLLDDTARLVAETTISTSGTRIIFAKILDPYIAVLNNRGNMALYQVNELSKTLQLCGSLTGLGVTCCTLYLDGCGGRLLQTVKAARRDLRRSMRSRAAAQPRPSSARQKGSRATLEIDSNLYGDEPVPEELDEDNPELEDDDILMNVDPTDVDPDVEMHKEHVTEENVSRSNGAVRGDEKSFWCLIYRDNGSFEIYTVPGLEPRFVCSNFSLLPGLVFDQPPVTGGERPRTPAAAPPTIKIEEMVLTTFGKQVNRKRPYLLLRMANNELAIYEAFNYVSIDGDSSVPGASDDGAALNRLATRFSRVHHEHISWEPTSYVDREGDKLQPISKPSSEAFLRQQLFKPFEDIGHADSGMYSGVFMSGPRPCWIMVATRLGSGINLEAINGVEGRSTLDSAMPLIGQNVLRVHPAAMDGPVQTFAGLHNVNINNGFLYATSGGSVKIAQLPSQFRFDTEWPVCKVSLHRTAHKITYHHPSLTYAMSTSTKVPFALSRAQHAAAVAAGVIEEAEETEGGNRNSDLERDVMRYLPEVSAHRLELVSPVTWETVDKYIFDEYEQVLCVETVELKSKQTASGRKCFIAVGTGAFRGEDLTARGKIYVFEIIDVVPEIDNPQTNHKLKLLYQNEEKTPVSAVSAISGYLLVAIGSKIIIHSFEDAESLVGVAFLDVNIYVTTVSVVKNLILVGDISKSVWFLGFQEEPPKLALLGKDFNKLSVYSSAFLVNDNLLSLLVADGDKNLHMFSYAPYNIQSYNGQKLIRKGEFHVGNSIDKMICLRRQTAPGGKMPTGTPSVQFLSVYGSLDGSLGMVLPVSEKLYKRMYALYSRMVQNIQHAAALNPRGFRQLQLRSQYLGATSSINTGLPGPKFILDGDLIYRYSSFSKSTQRELAKGIGSEVERIMDDLLEVTGGTDFF
ncbi:CPSF A subunit region-domain-containing protein [Polychytrium aggregatum]|uniref:CPSF A subunit region-domain-containing protein n=1 Tax=Polychytrium aggregatum TaxID=110093 RepID=UPI0022FDB6FF|nr:CPSF A subunit region-domain-containing protein [Polychytrium aggregatum]KAI9205850.1 CPSF A subunit region-domain-containing protein [Polychytrium aggregatum]